MNSTTINNSILHRPSRRIKRVALPVACSGTGKRNQATAGTSNLHLLPISIPPVPSLIVTSSVNNPSHRPNTCSPSSPQGHVIEPSSLSSFLKPRCPVHIAAFNVRTLRQTGQQAALVRTLDSLAIDICCISETRIQDPSVVSELTAPSLTTRYFLRTSGTPELAAAGQAGVGIVLSSRAEASVVDWIPINSRLCAVRIETAVRTDAMASTRRCLFVVSAYAPTNCSSDTSKDEFYSELYGLLRMARSSDITLVLGDMNARVGRLTSSELRLGGNFGLDSTRSDNGERLLQMCADHQLFLSSTNFRRSNRRCATWRPPTDGLPWTQIDHVLISYRWRGSMHDCRSFWNTYVDSDHALVRCRFSITFSGKARKNSPKLAVEKLSQSNVKVKYQDKLQSSISVQSTSDIDSRWKTLTTAMYNACSSVCGISDYRNTTHWISTRSLDILEKRRQIPPGNAFNSDRKIIRRQLKLSLRADRELWWNHKASEMEVAFQSGNSRKLFHLIRTTGPKKATVSETISESDGAPIYNKERRLSRWAEHFEEQFSWPAASTQLPMIIPQSETWSVNLDPPSVAEVRRCISALKRHRAAGPDDLMPALFKDGGDVICSALADLFKLIWDQESVPQTWGESIIVPLFKKGNRSSCGNHRGISLTPVVTRLFASLILRRLTPTRESQIREEQAGFRPGRGCIDHIFTLRQLLEQRHVYRRPTIAVFLDFKGAFDSVDRSVLFDILALKGMPTKFRNILQALYLHTTGRVRVYNELSDSFTTTSGVRQGCPISPFLFNFIIDAIMDCTLSGLQNVGIEVSPGGRLVDLDYADDIVMLFDNFEGAQATMNRLVEVVPSFGMQFAPSKCKVLLQDYPLPHTNLTLQGQVIEVVDSFTYLGSCITSSSSAAEDITARIAKARLAFLNLRHLWRQKGLPLRLKGRVYSATVRAVLLYASETWPLRVEDLRRLQTFDHRCLRSIARVSWRQRVSNDEVLKRIFGRENEFRSLEQQIGLHRLRWLGHVLRMPIDRLPSRALFSVPGRDWRKVQGGQVMTWQRQMRSATSRLGTVGSCRLPGWGPRSPPFAWLETLRDMAFDRSQWRTCCKHLVGSSE